MSRRVVHNTIRQDVVRILTTLTTFVALTIGAYVMSGCNDAPAPADAGAPAPADAGAPVPADAGVPAPADAGAPVPADAGVPAPADGGSPKVGRATVTIDESGIMVTALKFTPLR